MKKTLFALSTIFALLLSAFISANAVMAQITNPAIGEWGDNAAGAESGSLFATIFVYFWRAIILVGALLVIFFFVSGAIDYISAGGEKGKTEAARNKITTAVIGFIILIFSFTAIAVIGNVIGFNLLDINFSGPNAETPTNIPGSNLPPVNRGGGTIPNDPTLLRTQ
jgi:hypothetical protein